MKILSFGMLFVRPSFLLAARDVGTKIPARGMGAVGIISGGQALIPCGKSHGSGTLFREIEASCSQKPPMKLTRRSVSMP